MDQTLNESEQDHSFDTNGGAHEGNSNPLSFQPPKEEERLDEIEDWIKNE